MVAEDLAVVAADIQGEVMIVVTTVEYILHLEEEAIVAVTEVEPEGMRLIESCKVTSRGAVQAQKVIVTQLMALPSHGLMHSPKVAILPCAEGSWTVNKNWINLGGSMKCLQKPQCTFSSKIFEGMLPKTAWNVTSFGNTHRGPHIEFLRHSPVVCCGIIEVILILDD